MKTIQVYDPPMCCSTGLRRTLSSCVGVFGICFCAAQAELRGSANDDPEKHPE